MQGDINDNSLFWFDYSLVLFDEVIFGLCNFELTILDIGTILYSMRIDRCCWRRRGMILDVIFLCMRIGLCPCRMTAFQYCYKFVIIVIFKGKV